MEMPDSSEGKDMEIIDSRGFKRLKKKEEEEWNTHHTPCPCLFLFIFTQVADRILPVSL